MKAPEVIVRLNEALQGRYRIERELGEGGMATVYLAHDVRHEREVALKVLKPELAAVIGAGRFLAEIKTTANLQHPHILPLYDSGEADGVLFYVMPYVQGESLRDRLDREHQLPVDEAVRVASNVAEALDYAHRQGVIHRDIKPANVLLQDGKPVISDFGIALAVMGGGGGRLTETGLSLGTPHYMSPEQATGDSHVGPTADLWALGCVLYEMLAGEPPHSGSTAQAVLGSIITGEVEPVTRHRRQVPRHVENVIGRALEHVPADRFLTGSDFAAALADPGFRHGSPDAPPAPRVLRRSMTAIVASALALAVGWSFGERSAERGGGGPRHSSILFPRQDLLEGGGWGLQPVAASADRIVYRVAEAHEGLSEGAFAVARVGELWSRRFSESESTVLSGTRGAAGAFVSPDGQWVAYYDALEGALKRIPAAGGTVETIVAVEEEPFLGGAWAGDGSIAYAVRSGIWSVPETGGAPRRLTEPEPGALHRQPHFLPDGGRLVFTVSDSSIEGPRDRVAVLGQDAMPHVLVDGHSPFGAPSGHLVFGRGDEPREPGDLWVAALGRGATDLASDPVRVRGDVRIEAGAGGSAALYTISSDGTLLYVSNDVVGVIDLYRATRDGRFYPLIEASNPQLPPGTWRVNRPRISPDGDRVAFVADGRSFRGRLFVLDIGRGVVSRVGPDLTLDAPVWSRDGNRLIAAHSDGDGWGLVALSADGTGDPEVLLAPESGSVSPYRVSPDGRFLIFVRWPGASGPGLGGSDVWLLPLEGGTPRAVVQTEANETQPEVSPDGRWLAYISDASGQRELYVTDFPEAQGRMLVSTGSTGEAFAPIWRSDALYFLSERGMMSADVSTGSRFETEVPKRLFEVRIYPCCGRGRPHDVSPDGDWLVWIYPRVEGFPRIEMVQNWLDGAEAG